MFIFIFKKIYATEKGQLKVDAILLKMPVVGFDINNPRIKELKSGIDILKALIITKAR